MAYDPYGVHARAFGSFQNKMGGTAQGSTCPTFLWNGVTYLILPNTTQTKEELSTGGVVENFQLRFSTLTAQFLNQVTTTPDAVRQLMMQQGGTPMTYLGGSYKITTVRISPNGLVLTIEANALNQNA